MMAAVRQQLSELAASVRSDLERMRKVADDPASVGETSPLAVSGSSHASADLSPRDPEGGLRQTSDSHPGVEVERKFIVSERPLELDRVAFDGISQGYLAIGEEGLEVRLRRRGKDATLTVKEGAGRTRREEEIALEPEQFERMWPLTEGRRVEKMRYFIGADDGLTIELDCYANELDGLSTAEVEFDTEARADAFEPPAWFGPEVTDDPRYRNARLARDGAPPPPRIAPEPFCLHPGESATMGVRRIICGQIDAAIDDLGAGAVEDPGEAVHASRKRFKRVRAAARLVRQELDADAYRQENAAFREFGRRLSDARDSQVLLETLDALCERYAVELPYAAFARLRAKLLDDHRAAEQRVFEGAAAHTPIIGELRAARMRVGSWRLQSDAPSQLAAGFERIYSRARRAYRATRKEPTDERFHELRKRSKDLWHATQIVRPIATKQVKRLGDRAHRLSDLVGDDHDLAILSQQAELRPDCVVDKRERARLQALITRRRRQIQREAVELAEQTFGAKPQELASVIGRVH